MKSPSISSTSLDLLPARPYAGACVCVCRRIGVRVHVCVCMGVRGDTSAFKALSDPLQISAIFIMRTTTRNQDSPIMVLNALIARSTSPLIKETTSNNTTMMIFIMVIILLAFNFMIYLSY